MMDAKDLLLTVFGLCVLWGAYGVLRPLVGAVAKRIADGPKREASADPRLSLEERYKNHEGYVAAVRTAAAKAVAAGFLLQADADKLIADAAASNVLIPSSTSR